MKIGDRVEVNGKLVEVTSVMGKNFAYKPVTEKPKVEEAKIIDTPRRGKTKKEA